jgi:hypothetical protein
LAKENGLVVANNTEPERLAGYIRSLPEFKLYTEIDGCYGHLGATLADAVLQSNNNYKRSVRHRIARILRVYPHEVSLHDLERLLQRVTPQEFLDWNGTRKPTTFLDLVGLLRQESVNTEDALRGWLQRDGSAAKLRSIRFIGPKTVDYLKILVGLPNAAMDRHMFEFLQRAGLGKLNYARGKDAIHRAADLMKLNRAHLDHSIWRYMSGDRGKSGAGGTAAPGCAKTRTSKALFFSSHKAARA